jgi:putative ATP-grasp target RiPP
MTGEATAQPVTEAAVMDVLRHVYDPELQLNVVELGLIYGVEITRPGGVRVRMTLTSQGCPYGPALVAEVKGVLMALRGVESVDVEVVWTPPWEPGKMSEEARLELGMDI